MFLAFMRSPILILFKEFNVFLIEFIAHNLPEMHIQNRHFSFLYVLKLYTFIMQIYLRLLSYLEPTFPSRIIIVINIAISIEFEEANLFDIS